MAQLKDIPVHFRDINLNNQNEVDQWLRLIASEPKHFYKPLATMDDVIEYSRLMQIRVHMRGELLVATGALQFQQVDDPWLCTDEVRFIAIPREYRPHGLGRAVVRDQIAIARNPDSLGVGVYAVPGHEIIERLLFSEGFGPNPVDIRPYGYSNEEIHYYLFNRK